MNGLVESLRRLGPTRLLVMGILGAALLAAFFVLVQRVGAPKMALLYGDLSVEDSSEIVGQLEAEGVPFELEANGRRIMVPGDRALRLRLAMAREGLPAGGSVGYELFDRGQSLGTTSFVQNINRLRALEGELSRTIRTIDRIAAARVHLVLPRRDVFARERRKPSASIALRMRGSSRLDAGQVRAVQHLVAAAVPDLEPERVSIIDDRGQLLSRGGGAATAGAGRCRSDVKIQVSPRGHYDADILARFRDAGVDQIVLPLFGRSADVVRKRADALAADTLA